MRYFTAPFLLLLLNVFSTNTAVAQSGVFGQVEKLHFVAETQIPGTDQSMLSVCIVTKKYQILFMGLHQASMGYVLAENKCDTSSYLSITAEELAEGKSLGAIPQSVPDTPKITFLQHISGYLFWIIALVALTLVFIKVKKRRPRAN